MDPRPAFGDGSGDQPQLPDRLPVRGDPCATSSLQGWVDIKDPRVVGLIGDLKEQKEAVRVKKPLLAYTPKSQQAIGMRALAREVR